MSNVLSRANGNDTLLVINRIGGNLMTKADPVETIFGLLFDDQENGFNFCVTTAVCQFRSPLSNNFPRTGTVFERVIAAGRSGWMKFWSTSDAGILGAAINHNPQAGTASGASKQGHNLHKLTFTPAAVLTIPVFAPSC